MFLELLISACAGLVLLRLYLNKLYGTIDRNNEISAKGKIVIITGANAGLGRSTALEFAQRDAQVILACRDMSRANEAIKYIREKTTSGKMVAMQLDLGSLESVRKFAREFCSKYEKLDILVNNGAVMLNPEKHLKTSDGFEIHFGVNHLGHFLLTKLLLEKLKNGAASRVVNVSAICYPAGSIERLIQMGNTKEQPTYTYNFVDKLLFKQVGHGNKPYSDSKLANALFSMELSKRMKGTSVRTYALCPGIVATTLTDSLDIPMLFKIPLLFIRKFFLKTQEQGCWTTMYCALSKDLINKSGEMYQHCAFWDEKDRMPLREEDASKLWDLSEKITGVITK